MFKLADMMLEWLEKLIDTIGYPGIAIAIFLENIFPPIPSEIIMAGAGLSIASGKYHIVGVVVAATIGAVLSAIVFYALGYYGGRPLVEKYGKYLRITKKDLDYTDKWFEKHGISVVFFGRFIPIVRTLVSFPAGIAKEKFGPFLIYTTLGSAIWLTILTIVGWFFGEKIHLFLDYMENFEHITMAVLAVACLGFAYWFYKAKFAKKKVD